MNLFAQEKSGFFRSLHACRGLAALIVLFVHLQMRCADTLFSGRTIPLFNGSAAVAFFFVLSGLVIGLSLARDELTLPAYLHYGVRRAFRIMPLMIVTVTVGGIYLMFIDPYMPVQALPPEYGDFTPAKFLSAYIGYSLKPNPPIWSIFVEIIGSVLLPLMVLTGRRKLFVIATGAALLAFACFDLGQQHHWNFFMINFFLGMTILWWGKDFVGRVKALDAPYFWLLCAALLALFYLPRMVFAFPLGDPRPNLIEVAAITPLIAILCYAPERFVVLTKPALQFLGDISFSLYLTHHIVLVLAINAIFMAIPDAQQQPARVIAVMALTIPFCLWLAALSYKYIEQPGIRAGKKALALYNGWTPALA